MENQKRKLSVDLITTIIVLVVVIIMIITKASEIKKENVSLRQGSNSSATK